MDVFNLQLVGVCDDTVVVAMPARTMTKRQALVHAAWLVVVADDDDEFYEILSEVKNA